MKTNLMQCAAYGLSTDRLTPHPFNLCSTHTSIFQTQPLDMTLSMCTHHPYCRYVCIPSTTRCTSLSSLLFILIFIMSHILFLHILFVLHILLFYCFALFFILLHILLCISFFTYIYIYMLLCGVTFI